MRHLRLVLFLLAIGCRPAVQREPQASRPHVYVVVVDGLDARLATPASMPRLFGLAEREPAHTTIVRTAVGVMPARTNPNHVSLLTGTYAEAHGITGNAYLPRSADAKPAKLDAAALIEVETLYTVIESEAPALVTAGVFGKPKLGRLFAAVPERQHAPDILWTPEELPSSARDAATGYSFDADTMAAALARFAEREPDLAVLNLADVDRTAHGLGPDTPACARAVAGADEAIGRLVDDLVARGRWARSVVFVTADHGFTAIDASNGVVALGPVLARARLTQVVPVADGGVEHFYAVGGDAASMLPRAAALAATTPGVAEVLARVPTVGVPGLADRHPDWHLDHERAGDLLLVAAPGHQFVDPDDPVDARLRGNHGGPQDLRVPLVVSGGLPALRAAPNMPVPRTVDLAPTIAWLLGVRRPRRVDGSPVPAASAGRALVELLAPRPCLGADPDRKKTAALGRAYAVPRPAEPARQTSLRRNFTRTRPVGIAARPSDRVSLSRRQASVKPRIFDQRLVCRAGSAGRGMAWARPNAAVFLRSRPDPRQGLGSPKVRTD